MKKIIIMICCVLALTSLSCAAYTDYDLDESYDKGYGEGYYWGYREGYFADRSAPNNDIIDRSELGGKATWNAEEEEAPAVSASKATESNWTKYYPFIIVALVGICILSFVLVHVELKNYRTADNRCSQYYSVLREIAVIVKTRPVTAEEIDNILKKYQ